MISTHLAHAIRTSLGQAAGTEFIRVLNKLTDTPAPVAAVPSEPVVPAPAAVVPAPVVAVTAPVAPPAAPVVPDAEDDSSHLDAPSA